MSIKVHLSLLPTTKTHISFSELSEFFSCSWKHYLHQIKKIDLQVPSPSLMFGTCTHSGCEKYLRTRILDIQSCIDMLTKMWKEAQSKTRKELKITNEQYKKYVEDFSDKELQKALKQLASILNDIPKFLDDTFPGWEFIEAEHQLLEQIDEIDNNFKGFIDGVISYYVKKKKYYLLLDWKTSNRGWTKYDRQDAMKRNQLIFYKHFYSKKHPEIKFKDIKCGFIILCRGNKPGKHCEFLPVSVGEVTEARAVKLARSMIKCMLKGTKIKNRLSCLWCEYFGTEHCDSIHRQLG
jgi:hypothetical protein